MGAITIHHDRVQDPQNLISLCPFGALCCNEGRLEITGGCRMCKLCVRKGPQGVFEYIEEPVAQVNKSEWKGIAVYVEHSGSNIHPVTFELIGKARELAQKTNQPVYALVIGWKVGKIAEEMLFFGIDQVFVYDDSRLEHFRIEPFAATFEAFIHRAMPSTILVGGTTIGRSLAPRVAARFRTGLTADCTFLDMQPNTDLDQIRPAFGGNIMAHIRTPNHRPQFATVRYKIFNPPTRGDTQSGEIIDCSVKDELLASRIRVLSITDKPKTQTIEEADVLVVAGRGFRREKDLELVQTLADRLGGMLATTRPLVEAGWADPRRQIGLSGRTVKPRLMITAGVSGAIQFVAGMKSSDTIIAINTDADAPIMDVAHLGVIGDLYEILPELIAQTTREHKPGTVTVPSQQVL